MSVYKEQEIRITELDIALENCKAAYALSILKFDKRIEEFVVAVGLTRRRITLLEKAVIARDITINLLKRGAADELSKS